MTIAAWNVWRVADGWTGASPAITSLSHSVGAECGLVGHLLRIALPGWALLEIILLWAAILASTILFWRISTFSGALLLPTSRG
jgi:translocator protein